MMEQPLKRRRCAEQGHVYFLPHDGCRHVNAFDTRENVGHQIAPLVGFGISPIRDLIVRRAVDVVEDGPRSLRRAIERKSPMLLHRSTRTGSSTFAHYKATGLGCVRYSGERSKIA